MASSPFPENLRSVLAKKLRASFVEALRASPDITLRQLGRFAAQEFGGTVSEVRLSDLVTLIKHPTGKRGTKRPSPLARAARPGFDERIFEAVKKAGGPVAAGVLLKQEGGSPLQIRNALARLIEAGRVAWSGRARGTRYFLA